MFSPDGRHIVFGSNRNNGGTRDTNVFIAEWVESGDYQAAPASQTIPATMAVITAARIPFDARCLILKPPGLTFSGPSEQHRSDQPASSVPPEDEGSPTSSASTETSLSTTCRNPPETAMRRTSDPFFTVTSPFPSRVIMGACPYRMPIKPSYAGTTMLSPAPSKPTWVVPSR